MQKINGIFFGSTTDSLLVLERIHQLSNTHVSINCVVTQPPRPVGRAATLTPTPVETWATAHGITVLSFPSNPDKPWLYENETQVIDTLEPIKADLLISASYGQKIPTKNLTDARLGGLNVHPSILPRWRGGDPVPWAIMTGDQQIGVTVVSLSEHFDEGLIFAQEKIPILPTDTSDPLRAKLFGMGAQLLATLLPQYLQGKAKGHAQNGKSEPRATRLTRDTGFEPWDLIQKALTDSIESARIERKFRALIPWPGVWSKVTVSSDKLQASSKKRIKILACHLSNDVLVIDQVQLEGKNPVSWKQFVSAYLTTS